MENDRLKDATNIMVIVMCTVWVAYVGYLIVRDRKQKPMDVLITTSPAPREEWDNGR